MSEDEDINSKKSSIREQYYIKVSRIIIICGIMGIGTGVTMLNLFNYSNDSKVIPNTILLIIDFLIVIPEILILIVKYKKLVTNGRMNEKIFNQVKRFALILTFVNYYMFTLLIPSKELWGGVFF